MAVGLDDLVVNLKFLMVYTKQTYPMLSFGMYVYGVIFPLIYF